MGYEPSNIGFARLEVSLLDGSPFNGIPKQEFGNYFTIDNMDSLVTPTNIYALPAPVWGLRLTEENTNCHNFLVDSTGVALENATTNVNGGTVRVSESSHTLYYFTTLIQNGVKTPQDDFFTWSLEKNIYDEPSLPFSDMLAPENPSAQGTVGVDALRAELGINSPTTSTTSSASKSRWVYKLNTRPDSDNQAQNLCPFMSQATINSQKSIHWGVKKTTPMPYGMPFEILYFHENEEFSIAQNDANHPSIKFQAEEFKSLTNKAYFIIELGANDPNHNYIFLFVSGDFPKIFKVENGQAIFKYKFEFMNGDALFTKNNKYFSCKFEPMKYGILVRISSEQFSVPWVISGTQNDPILVTSSPIGLYGGNIQAGFNMRPIQYAASGSFKIPEITLDQYDTDDRFPITTTAVKGVDTNQQNVSFDSQGNPVLFACDAEIEESNTASSYGITTPFSALNLNGGASWSSRRIHLQTDLLPSDGVTAGDIIRRTYQTTVSMFPGDILTSTGYVITNGKSPVLWQVRNELEQIDEGGEVGETDDISCDVLSCELNWNSTSINEISHTATLKVLNGPFNTKGKGYYTGLMNRCVYFRIKAWWENGAGEDPGGDGRVIFTGYSTSASREQTREKEVLVFKLEDFMHALEGSKFILSPYYDGMKAHLAVADIAKRLGISASKMFMGDAPLDEDTDDPAEYGLPFANPFEEPQFHFKDGSSLKSAILKIAQLDGKCVYFDGLGNFHYDPIPGDIFGDDTDEVKAEFFTIQDQAPSAKNVCWNSFSASRTPGDVYNAIHVATVIKETGNLFHAGWANSQSVSNPGSEGYVGYRRYLIIKDPSLASIEAATKALTTYMNIVTTPPRTSHFETYGYSSLKPMDVVQVDGQPYRIVSISSNLDAKEKNYFMSVEGEWFAGGAIVQPQ